MRFSSIRASASYLPQTVVENGDLHQFPAKTLPLIEQKTGVRARRHASADQTTSSLAIEAARSCLASANLPVEQLDGIILSTSSPDRIQPATASSVQFALGASRAFACDVNAVCSGALYALHFADGLIRSGKANHILVCAAELYSRILNPRDFSTYPYFGDGAGAVLLSAASSPGILTTQLGADGSGADLIQIPAGGTLLPYRDMQKQEDQYFKMQGRAVYDFAVHRGALALREALHEAGVAIEDVDFFVLHQANINILYSIADSLGVSRDKFVVNLDRFGNTASASVLIAFDEAYRSTKETNSRTATFALAAFGGGLAWGAAVIRA